MAQDRGDAAANGNATTFPRLLALHAHARGARAAIREKDLGIWQTWTWREVQAEVLQLAAGLASLGFKRGDALAIIGENRPRLYWAMTAAQCLGGIPVPFYQDAVAGEMVFALKNAEVRFAIVEDQEQTDKLIENPRAVSRTQAHRVRRCARHAALRRAGFDVICRSANRRQTVPDRAPGSGGTRNRRG